MAEVDHMTSCPVCFETYQETGSHVPRLLPCTHTVCESCIRALIRGKFALSCPECREEHPVHSGVKTFTQNKYILTHLQRQVTQGGLGDTGNKRTTNGNERPKQETKGAAGGNAKFKVLRSIKTPYDHISGISLLVDSSVVICACKRFSWQLVRYSLQSGKEMSRAQLAEPPQGMARVTLGGEQRIALSYGDSRTIVFHDANDLQQVQHRCAVSPHWPARMCVASPTTLLYIDVTKDPCEIRYLDCAASQPQPETRVTQTQQHFVRDMCYVQQQQQQQDGDKSLLVTTHFSTVFDKRIESGIRAYNTATQEMEWCITGKIGEARTEAEISPCGVATDGRGHLFICDPVNGCVQMFSTVGQYLGVLLKEGDHGLGKPRWLCWIQGISSLVLTHEKNKLCYIDVIHVGQISKQLVSVQFVPSHFSTA